MQSIKHNSTIKSRCKDHVLVTYQCAYHSFDALWVHEAVVERVDRVLLLDPGLSLQQDGARIQTVVRPEDAEACLLISLHQCPEKDSVINVTL